VFPDEIDDFLPFLCSGKPSEPRVAQKSPPGSLNFSKILKNEVLSDSLGVAQWAGFS